MVGASEHDVTPWALTAAANASGRNAATGSTVARAWCWTSMLYPATWHIGNASRYTPPGCTERPATVPRAAVVRDRWVCRTPFGVPVDPLVNSSHAGSSGSTGPVNAAESRSARCHCGSSNANTCSSEGTARRTSGSAARYRASPTRTVGAAVANCAICSPGLSRWLINVRMRPQRGTP